MDNLNTARAQGIIGALQSKGPLCFVGVLHDHESADGKTRAALGVAVANERGYYPIPQFYFHAESDLDAAEAKADTLNREQLGIDSETRAAIQISTMGGQPYRAPEGFAEARRAAAAAFDAEFLK